MHYVPICTNVARLSHNTTRYFTDIHEVTLINIYNYPQGSLFQWNIYKKNISNDFTFTV